MDENSELVNKYIEKLNEEIAESTKRRIVVEAQYAYLEETLEKRDAEFTKKLAAREAELRQDFSIHSENSAGDYHAQIQQIKGEREALQDECNNLRIERVHLRSALEKANEELLKKKKKTPVV